ncbi:hypothetical protein BDZ97DRAFT_1919886 [Flammula alnicola]|nr:hypothetical protein BDZ97DRAFT_1919886 [Flammula alnicola]
MPSSFRELDDEDALEAASIAATKYRNSPLVGLNINSEQGDLSLTFAAKYGDGTESIIQLRDSSIDTGIVLLAHTLLGDIVPIVTGLPATKTSYTYGQPKVSGSRWDPGPLVWTRLEDDCALAVQFASILVRCSLHIESKSGVVVDNYIIPRLDHIIDIVSSDSGPFKNTPGNVHAAYLDRIKGLRSCADNLKVLDLILCHTDPHSFNIIIDDSSPPNIMALLDWEGATFLPFGLNAFHIRFICVINQERRDILNEATNSIAIAFWNTLTAAVPHEHKHAVLDAVEIGLVILFEFPQIPEVREERTTANSMEHFLLRLDWFEELFRPLC